jgi:glycosyltransferase involved in cell wall biosynthesis
MQLQSGVTEGGATRPRPGVVLVAEPRSSSGLPEYLHDALRHVDVDVAYEHVGYPRHERLLARALSVRWPRRAWFREYERRLIYTPAAWGAWSRRAARAARRHPGAHALLLGGLGSLEARPYSLFLAYTMELALRDGVSPWVPSRDQLGEFLDLERRHYARAHVLFTSAEYVRQSLIDDYGVAPDRAVVVGMGLDPRLAGRRRAEVPDQARHLLFVGRTFDLKGGPQLLAAFERLQERVPDATLTIVGPASLEQRLPANARFLGPIADRDALAREYEQADLFVLPSLCDSFGFVFLEAMAYGLPCIGTTMNAMPEILDAPRCGFVARPHDVDGLADTLERALLLPAADRARMSEAAYLRATQMYQWPAVARRMRDAWRARGVDV